MFELDIHVSKISATSKTQLMLSYWVTFMQDYVPGLYHSSVLQVIKSRKWPGDEASACVGLDMCG